MYLLTEHHKCISVVNTLQWCYSAGRHPQIIVENHKTNLATEQKLRIVSPTRHKFENCGNEQYERPTKVLI